MTCLSAAAEPSAAQEDPECALLCALQVDPALQPWCARSGPGLGALWERFYRRYGLLIRRQVRLRHLSEPDRSDCVQEVWLAVLLHLDHFRPDPRRACLRTWMAILARNTATDFACRPHPLEPSLGLQRPGAAPSARRYRALAC